MDRPTVPAAAEAPASGASSSSRATFIHIAACSMAEAGAQPVAPLDTLVGGAPHRPQPVCPPRPDRSRLLNGGRRAHRPTRAAGAAGRDTGVAGKAAAAAGPPLGLAAPQPLVCAVCTAASAAAAADVMLLWRSRLTAVARRTFESPSGGASRPRFVLRPLAFPAARPARSPAGGIGRAASFAASTRATHLPVCLHACGTSWPASAGAAAPSSSSNRACGSAALPRPSFGCATSYTRWTTIKTRWQR